MKPSIYGLFGRDGELRYIGKANDPEKRLASHMRDCRRRDTPVYRWIRKHGLPQMRVLSPNCDDWRAEERRLIAEAKADGARLLNVAEGGDEPFCSTETRRANGRQLADRIQSDAGFRRVWEIKRAMARLLRSDTMSDERKERMRETMRQCAAKAPHIFGAWSNI